MNAVNQQFGSLWTARTVIWIMGTVLLLVSCGQSTLQAPPAHKSPVAELLNTGQLPHRRPSATPAPITPFPTTYEDELATLQAHGRFFYGGNPTIPEVALTFDDGPNPPFTTQVLAVLKHYGIHATFFCLGNEVAAYPDLVRQEVADGHVIGNHSWFHPLLTTLSAAQIRTELTTTGDIIQQVTGKRPIFFRPPYGSVNAQVLTQANQLGLTTFIWSDGSLDWTPIGPAAIVHQVLSTVANGAIILMHDGGGNRSRTLAALPGVIEGLEARHFRFVTLGQLVADTQGQPSQ